MSFLIRLFRGDVTYDTWTAAGVNLVLALWLLMSAWVVGYDQDRAFWVPMLSGGLVGLSAGLRLGTRLEGPAFHLADLAIAAWLVVAALGIAETAAARGNRCRPASGAQRATAARRAPHW